MKEYLALQGGPLGVASQYMHVGKGTLHAYWNSQSRSAEFRAPLDLVGYNGGALDVARWIPWRSKPAHGRRQRRVAWMRRLQWRGMWAMQAKTPHVRPGSPAPEDAHMLYIIVYMNLYGRHWPHRPGAARTPLVNGERNYKQNE